MEEYERAISIVIAPQLDEIDKEDIFNLGFESGFTTFFTPIEAVVYNDLNDEKKRTALVKEWSSDKDESFMSGVLCVPDNVILPRDFRFRLGEYLTNKKTCIYELTEPITIPSCFSAAALVARNDNTRFVQERLRNPRVRFHPSWPCIGLRFEEKQYAPLWVSQDMSDGVILEQSIAEKLPLFIFEHSRNSGGRPNRQRVRHLNTLYVKKETESSGERPVSVTEYRVRTYLDRAMMVNTYPHQSTKTQRDDFCTTFKGIWQQGIANSILDKDCYKLIYNDESKTIRIISLDNDQVITEIKFTI
jgi:hypothetical protein